MALSLERLAEINRQAQQIKNKRARKIAEGELAGSGHETRKKNIRQELADLNRQLAEDPQLKRNLLEVLRTRDSYQTYKEVDRKGLCIGLPISKTSGQIALMTEEGIQVLQTHLVAKYNRGLGTHQVECFYPLDLKEADVNGLFPERQFRIGQLADDIVKIVLHSPAKK